MSSIKDELKEDSNLKVNSIKSEKQFMQLRDLSLIKSSHSKNKSYDIKNSLENNFMKSTLESDIEASSLTEELNIKLCFMTSKFCKMRKIKLFTLYNYYKFKSFATKEMLSFKSFLDSFYSKISPESLVQHDLILKIIGFDEKSNTHDIKTEDEWNKFINKLKFGGSFNDSNLLSSYLKSGKPKFYIIVKSEYELNLELSLKSKNSFFFNDVLDMVYESVVKDKNLVNNLIDHIKEDSNLNFSNSNIRNSIELDQTIIKQDNDYSFLINSLFDQLKLRNKYREEVKTCIDNHNKKSDFSIENSDLDLQSNEEILKIKLQTFNSKYKEDGNKD